MVVQNPLSHWKLLVIWLLSLFYYEICRAEGHTWMRRKWQVKGSPLSGETSLGVFILLFSSSGFLMCLNLNGKKLLRKKPFRNSFDKH